MAWTGSASARATRWPPPRCWSAAHGIWRWCPTDARQRLAWRSPLSDTLADLVALRPRRVAVLATGDPLWFGIGRLLLRHVPAGELCILPHVSAFQEACARLGWALEEVARIDGTRPPARRVAAPSAAWTPTAGAHGRRVGTGGDRPDAGRQRARRQPGLGHGGTRRAAASGSSMRPPPRWIEPRFADLNVLAIETVLGLPELWCCPTCRACRTRRSSMTARSPRRRSAPSPWRHWRRWTVSCCGTSAPVPGASPSSGCGPGRRMRAVAIERDATRAARIGRNAARLGVPELEVRHGEAPGLLTLGHARRNFRRRREWCPWACRPVLE